MFKEAITSEPLQEQNRRRASARLLKSRLQVNAALGCPLTFWQVELMEHMRPIQSQFHRVLDFVTVVGFALAPSVLSFSGFAATLAYLLAVVHLLLTLITRFPPSERGVVPFQAHGVIEVVVGAALVLAPFALRWDGVPRTFYVGIGVVILAVWALTAYHPHTPRTAA
jgi:hypothetical protein